MSGSNLSGNDEFDEQLRMQELYGDPKEGDTQNEPSGETDSLGQPPDDTPYEWDLDKKAWFPKITEDFIASYQANYGFSGDGAPSSTGNVQDANTKTVEEPPQKEIPETTDSKKRGEKRKAESGWFHVEEDRNTNVYVSGLPPDITVDEFIQLMSKFGIIMRDPQTEEFKVKLYKDDQGNLKGDGLCCYLKKESVELALKLLDEDEIRGYKLHVEVAQFQLKGEYDASKKKKKCKDYKKKLSLQQKQLDWRPERRAGPNRLRHERVVILKNMFHPMDFEDDPLVLNEIREDLRVECSKFGQIRKLLLFDRHPDGVASVSFREPEEADNCIQTLDGRWFGGRQITAQAWDGTTDYQVEETSREREERLRGWEAFLNAPEANRGLQRMDSICGSERPGPSRVRHFSEHPSMSNMGAQEATTGMAFEETIDENKFEKAEDDGGESEGDASEKDAKEGESDGDYPERESDEGCSKTQTVQNVTLSLTLPITCHICLGKVRQPVVCTNNHVFCSICIDLWLKNNSQCPACRVPITTENPCKEIIGGTSESEPMLSHTVRRHLRRTRLELLHREYEDEIDCLQKEVEELKSKNLSLESQIKTILDPLALMQGSQNEDKHPMADNPSKIDPESVVEWKKKLRTANEIYEKVKDDVDKLKEANKKLKLENGGLLRENLRLKAEVDNRSPQKFGRFTVAALQSKVEQYERETNRLKKALERSDKYIEELESQVAQLRHSEETEEGMGALCQRAPSADGKGPKGSDDVAASKNPSEGAGKQAGSANSASHLATPSSSRLADTSSARQESTSRTEPNCLQNKDRYPKPTEAQLGARETPMDTYLERQWGSKPSDCAPYKEEELYGLQASCTPLSLSCLQLNTPENRENPVIKAGGSKKHANHLRKLVFDDFCDSPNTCNNNSSEDDRSGNEKKSDCFASSKTEFWDCCSTSYAQSLEFDGSEGNTIANPVGEVPSKLSEKSGFCLSKRLSCIRSLEMNRTRTSSEASMDAAYLDKISELDSMMSESDNSKSPCNNGFKSVESEGSSKSPQGREFLEEPDKLQEGAKLSLPKNALEADGLEGGSEWKPSSFFLLSPSDHEMSEDFSLHTTSHSGASEVKSQNCLFQTEFSQGVQLLSSSQGLFEDQRFGSSLFKMSSDMQSLPGPLQSPWSAAFVSEKRSKNGNQSAKRKIQSSLSNASPSKATKS